MAINPQHSTMQVATPLRSLSQLGTKSKNPPISSTNQTSEDQVCIKPPAADVGGCESPKQSSAWTKRTLMAAGLTTLAVASTLGGSLLSGTLASVSNNSAQVKVVKQNKNSNAPATLLQQQQEPTHLLTARIGVIPGNYSLDSLARIETTHKLEIKPGSAGCADLKYEISRDRLLSNKDGHVLYRAGDLELSIADFRDQAEVDWKTSSVLRPAGHYGKYLSVAETTTSFTGGSEATEVQLRTLDSKTGKVVNLSELVSAEDYQKMAQAITSGLNSAAGQHYQVEDMETLDSHMNNGFSLREGKEKSVILTVAIPSSVEADGGKVAEFTFSLPASALLP